MKGGCLWSKKKTAEVIPAQQRLSIINWQFRNLESVQHAGYKSVTFDASKLPSGIYTYRLIAGDYTATKKLINEIKLKYALF